MYKHPQQAIYCLRNTVDGRRYIGGTTNFGHRKATHLYELRRHEHPNKKLQDDYIVLGEAAFEFVILEPLENLTKNQIFDKEQTWLDSLQPEYNLNTISGNYFGDAARSKEAKEKKRLAMVGRKQSPEWVAKRVATMVRNGKQHLKIVTQEQRKHLSEINTGEKNPNWGLKRSDETKRKIGDKKAGNYVGAISPTGEVFAPIHNMSKFSVEHGLEVSNMVALMHGRVRICKGWTRFEPGNQEAAGGVDI